MTQQTTSIETVDLAVSCLLVDRLDLGHVTKLCFFVGPDIRYLSPNNDGGIVCGSYLLSTEPFCGIGTSVAQDLPLTASSRYMRLGT